MRTDFPARLQLELNSPAKKIAHYWKVTRKDGKVFGFTNHDQDVVLNDGVTYKSGTGATPSALQSSDDLSADNIQLEVLLDSDDIREVDLLNGLWDFAKVDCGIFVYTSTLNSSAILKTGTLGNVSVQGSMFTTELRGLMQQLQQGVSRVFSPECSVALGSLYCTVDLTPYTEVGSVTAVNSSSEFEISVVQPDSYFNYGAITFTSGEGSGLTGTILNHTSNVITLWTPLGVVPQIGDSFEITRGCDRRFETCKNTFNNISNFQGFPHLPGMDALTKGFTTS